MNTLATRLGVLAMAAVVILYGCGDNSDSPAGPKSVKSTSLAAQSACGEVSYLSELSPVLFVWEDSIEIWLGDGLLNAPPEWTGQSTVGDHLATLAPVLQQWEAAINDTLATAVLDTVADFDPAQTEHQEYLTVLSSLLSSWKADLEANRGVTFLPAPPVFSPDATAPEIACVADTTITCAGAEGIVLDFEITAIDDCDPAPVVTCVPPSGSTFPLGATEVTCTAADSSGNSSTCTFTVNVEAPEPPVITSATANPSVLWPPNHKWVDVGILVDVESACDAEVSCTISEVTSNEAVNSKGDGNTSPDWMIGSDGTLKLRAERSGNGRGRIYTVHFVCEDDFGNSVDGTVNVVVPHDQGGRGASR